MSAAALDRYMSDLQSLPLLTAQQEVSLAREIEHLMDEHWRALLSSALGRPIVVAAVQRALASGPSADSSKPLTRVLAACATSRAPQAALAKLRGFDKGGEALFAADSAVVEALADEPRARTYLERVARARNAQQAAKGRFVSANLRLVIALARRYERKRLMPLEDLIQEGNFGLIRAVERFDHRRGFRFSTYAAWWIRHSLNRALSDKARLVRVPVHALDDMWKVTRAIEATTQRQGQPPSNEQLAEQTGIPQEKLILLRTHARVHEPVSLDRSLGEEGNQSLHDILPCPTTASPDDAIELSQQCEMLGQVMTGLSPIEATTLRLRFGLGGAQELTLREIGSKYNLSRERIRQIQEEALAKLREVMKSNRSAGRRGGVAA